MTKVVAFGGVNYTQETLKDKTTGQLAELYNAVAKELGGREVSRFSDKPVAQRRTWGLLITYGSGPSTEEEEQTEAPKAKPAPAPKKAKAETEKKPRPPRKTRAMYFNFPIGDEIRKLRDENTLRGRCVTLLTDGAKFEDVKKLVREFDKDTERQPEHHIERRAYELVRIMHYYLGYGIRHNQETGVIKLFTKQPS